MKCIYKPALWLFIMVMLLSSAYAYADNSGTCVSPVKCSIILKDTASLPDVAKLIEENDLSINGFTTVITSGDTDITCGFVVRQQEEFPALWEDFVSQQMALLSDALLANKENSEILSDIYATKEAFRTNNLRIATVICNEDVTSAQKSALSQKIIDEVILIDSSVTANLSANTVPVKNTSRASTATNWVPTSGSAFAWESGSYDNATYLQVNYKWDSASELSTLTNDSDSTLEAEIVLRNYDGEAISNDWNTNYAYTTNQPRAYRDTQAFDHEDDEICFTVGCSSAAELEAGTQYYWYAYGNRTDSPSCRAKVYFQRGYRFPAFVYDSAWTVFPEETRTVVPFEDWNTATATSVEF